MDSFDTIFVKFLDSVIQGFVETQLPALLQKTAKFLLSIFLMWSVFKVNAQPYVHVLKAQ